MQYIFLDGLFHVNACLFGCLELQVSIRLWVLIRVFIARITVFFCAKECPPRLSISFKTQLKSLPRTIELYDILKGRQSRQKLQCLYGNRWQIHFSELNFSQFVNQNVNIRGRRLHSPILKDVVMLEVAELFFFIYIAYILLYIVFFPWTTASRRFYPANFTDNYMEN